LIPGELDGGPHQIIAPGATWRPTLPIRQPAATLLYHSHVHGLTAEQVYSGLAGALLVTDDEEQAWGSRQNMAWTICPAHPGSPVRKWSPCHARRHDGRHAGRRGDTILVNGAVNPLAAVPNRLVRLRLVNASNARIYELSFSDRRSFHWIGTEGGCSNTQWHWKP
jgi:FtsP/CotA-like multicopper oxidase with cupredoxin domain